MGKSDLTTILFPPLHVLIPADRALPTLIPPKFHAPAEILRYHPIPSCLVDGAIHSLNLIPPLFWNNIG